MKRGTIAKILVLLMLIQTWSLLELSQTYEWNSEKLFENLCHIMSSLSPKEANAGVSTVFGPKKYIRTTGKPNVYQDTFSATAGPAQIIILNGEENGQNRVSSAIISLNGKQIFGTKDFNQNVYRLEKSSELSQMNTLMVELRSKPESYLRIEIIVATSGPEIIADEQNRVSAIIAPEGGELSTIGRDGTKFILTFPAGSLLQPQEITFAPALSVSGLPIQGTLLAAVHMGPSGLKFETPATLTVEFLTPPSIQNLLVGFLFQDDGTDFLLIPAILSSNIATLQIDHFTGGGLVEVTNEELLNIATNAYREVLDALAAVTSCGESLENAINKTINLQKVADLSGIPAIFDLAETVKQWSENVITNIFLDADNQCKSDPSREVEAIQCIAAAQRSDDLGITITGLLADTLTDMKTCGLYSLSIEPENACLSVNQTQEFEAFARDRSGNRLENREFIWRTDNPGVAFLASNDSKAQVTAKSDGTTYIEVYDKMSLDLGVKIGTFSWNMAPINVGGTLEIRPPGLTMNLYQRNKLEAIFKTSDGSELPAEFTWSCGTCSVATVEPVHDTGVQAYVTTISGGKETITAKSKCGSFDLEATALITVPVEVKVTPDYVSLAINELVPLTATVTDRVGTLCTLCTVQWYSNNVGVADVNASGIVIGKAEGQATISAVCGDGIGVAAVQVFKPTVTVLPDQATIKIGDTKLLTATVTDSAGNPYSGCTVQWYSNNVGVANVAGGLVTGISQGVATISAVCDDSIGVATVNVVERKTWVEYPSISPPVPGIIAVDGNGNLFVAGTYHESAWPGGGSWPLGISINSVMAGQWSEITRLAIPDVDPLEGLIGFAVDRLGNMFVVYKVRRGRPGYPGTKYETAVRRYDAERGWEDPPEIIHSYTYEVPYLGHVSEGVGEHGSQIATDKNGNAIITWTVGYGVCVGDATSLYYTIHAIRYDVDLGWGAAIQFALEDPEFVRTSNNPYPTTGYQQGTPCSAVAMNPEGNAILVWTGFAVPNQSRAIRAREFKKGEGWGAPRRIAAPPSLWDAYTRILMDASGNAIVTSFTYAWGGGTRATHYRVQEGWQPSFIVGPTNFKQTSPPYRISMDEDGNAMIVYTSEMTLGIGSIMSKRYVDGVWDTEASVVDPVVESSMTHSNGLDAFALYGGGNATLITYESIKPHPTDPASYYYHARQYWPDFGWQEPVSIGFVEDLFRCRVIGGPSPGYTYGSAFYDRWQIGQSALIDEFGDASLFVVRDNSDYFVIRFE